MPELPDIAAYISALEARIVGQPLERVRVASAFLLRTAQPPLASVEGRVVGELRRIGKRIAVGVEDDLWLVLHLMIAGRLHWKAPAGGIDVFSSDLDSFRAVLSAENHTLKRALTDPRLLSGIGNAYSDEILHAAQLSPITLTHKLRPGEWEKLFAATRQTLALWINRLGAEAQTTNYCARCQTGGKVLADRSLSRLLRSDWPRTLDELEALKRR